MDKPQRASVSGAGRSGLLQDRQVVYVARGEAYRGASGGALKGEKMEKLSSWRTLRMGTYKWVAGISYLCVMKVYDLNV